MGGMRRIASWALLTVLISTTAGCGVAKSPPPVPEGTLGVVDAAAVEKAVAIAGGNELIGAQVAVLKGHDVVLQQGYGMADRESSKRVGQETVFRIGSLTKAFTAALALRLRAEGKLDFDERVPGAPGQDPTVTKVLQHTVDGEFKYANEGYQALGRLLAKRGGGRYVDQIAGMVQPAVPSLTRSKLVCDSVVPAYDSTARPVQRIEPLPAKQAGGAGMLCATATDLVLWQQQLREAHIVSPKDYAEMTDPSALSIEAGEPYGMGWFVRIDRVFHNGMYPGRTDPRGGNSGYLVWLPEQDLTIAVLANSLGDVPGLAQRIGEGVQIALGVPRD